MMDRSSKHALCLMALLATPIALADRVFKCVDGDGDAVYQGTLCTSPLQEATIDRRFSNVGSFANDKQTLIDEIHASRETETARQLERQQEQISRYVASSKRRARRCDTLKDELKRLYQKRRYQQVDRDAQDELVRQMREACAP